MTIEPICAVCGERHQSGDASLAVIDARIEARAYQGGLDAVHDLHTLRVALAERTRERDEWQKAGQQFVDMFDPCKPRADWPVLVAVATGVKHANGSLRAERRQPCRRGRGASLRERAAHRRGRHHSRGVRSRCEGGLPVVSARGRARVRRCPRPAA